MKITDVKELNNLIAPEFGRCLFNGIDLRKVKNTSDILVYDCRFHNVKWPKASKALMMFDWTACDSDELIFQFMLYDLHQLAKRITLKAAVEKFELWVNRSGLNHRRRSLASIRHQCPFAKHQSIRLNFYEDVDLWIERFDPTAPVPPKLKANKLLVAALENLGNTGFKSYWKKHI